MTLTHIYYTWLKSHITTIYYIRFLSQLNYSAVFKKQDMSCSTLLSILYNYYLVLWGSGITKSKKNCSSLIRKEGIKIVTNSHFLVYSEPIFKAMRALKNY